MAHWVNGVAKVHISIKRPANYALMFVIGGSMILGLVLLKTVLSGLSFIYENKDFWMVSALVMCLFD